MSVINKTRYAILGVLMSGPTSGYEIKALMGRSTVYFWRESDSTIYPMLKVLSKEGKVLSETVYIGKKKKEIYSIAPAGRDEFMAWFQSPTGSETPRNEFLLKLFFAADQKAVSRLFEERLRKIKSIYDEYKQIESRLVDAPNTSQKQVRLKALRYGLALLESEMQWLCDEK